MFGRLASQRLLEIRQVFRQSSQVFIIPCFFFLFIFRQFLIIQTPFDLISLFFPCSAGPSILLHCLKLCKLKSSLITLPIFRIRCNFFFCCCSTLMAQITIPTFHGNFLRRTKIRLVQIQMLAIGVIGYSFPSW